MEQWQHKMKKTKLATVVYFEQKQKNKDSMMIKTTTVFIHSLKHETKWQNFKQSFLLDYRN